MLPQEKSKIDGQSKSDKVDSNPRCQGQLPLIPNQQSSSRILRGNSYCRAFHVGFLVRREISLKRTTKKIYRPNAVQADNECKTLKTKHNIVIKMLWLPTWLDMWEKILSVYGKIKSQKYIFFNYVETAERIELFLGTTATLCRSA